MTTQEATIRRGVRNARYSTIPNHVFEDGRLSMEARWLLGYLLSKPDNWIVRVKDIRNMGNCGRDKAASMVNELVSTGYAEKEQRRDGGKFGNAVLVIYDEPRAVESPETQAVDAGVASLPHTPLPSTAEPSTDSPLTANPAHSNNLDLPNTDEYQSEKNASEGEEDKGSQAGCPADAAARKAVEKAFWGLIRIWPNLDGLPKDRWLQAWWQLTDDERQAAVDGYPDWIKLLERGGKAGKHTPRPSTYFSSKLWLEVPKTVTHAKAEPVKPMGRAWMATYIAEVQKPMVPEGAWPPAPAFVKRLIAEGGEVGQRQMLERRGRHGWPKVYDLHSRYTEGKPVIASPEMIEAGRDFVSVDLAKPVGLAWQQLFARMQLPWLPGEPDYAYFPPIAADDADLDRAVAKAFWGFKERIEGHFHAAAE